MGNLDRRVDCPAETAGSSVRAGRCIGTVVEINQRFREVYGWSETGYGQSLGQILPADFRDAHHAGFARFKLTEVSKVLTTR